MNRFFIILSAILVFGLAAGQNVAPTDNADDFDVDGSEAEVTQTVSVTVPEIFALHLDATHLDFDLTNLINQGDAQAQSAAPGDIVCVYGVRDFDGFLDPPNDLSNYAAGTRYEFAGSEWVARRGAHHPGHRDRRVAGNPRHVDWPRVELDDDGELVDKDAPIVCYRTFKMQKYTNSTDGWELSVERTTEIPGVNCTSRTTHAASSTVTSTAPVEPEATTTMPQASRCSPSLPATRSRSLAIKPPPGVTTAKRRPRAEKRKPGRTSRAGSTTWS